MAPRKTPKQLKVHPDLERELVSLHGQYMDLTARSITWKEFANRALRVGMRELVRSAVFAYEEKLKNPA